MRKDEYGRVLLTVILFVDLILINFSSCYALKSNSTQYYGYIDTGEGTYMLLGFDVQNGKLDKKLKCLTDVLETLDACLASQLRGTVNPQRLNVSSLRGISVALNNKKTIELLFVNTSTKNRTVSFLTEKKQIEDGNIASFQFKGHMLDNAINGVVETKIYSVLAKQTYTNSWHVQFCGR